eukprot:scaffold876_cov68-Phaeocystis_antarctica.AAC.10
MALLESHPEGAKEKDGVRCRWLLAPLTSITFVTCRAGTAYSPLCRIAVWKLAAARRCGVPGAGGSGNGTAGSAPRGGQGE